MSHFTIEMLSDQCGLSMPNLRAWQRYGLLTPARCDSGKRYFDYSHLLRAQLILKWLNQGVPINAISSLLNGEHAAPNCHWEIYQEALLAALEKPKGDKLRDRLRKFGRELPAAALINNVVRPLRLWLRERPGIAHSTRRVRFDTQLIEYATFVLQGMRKRPAATMTIVPLNMQDSIEAWLEGLYYASEGFRVEVLTEAIAHPELELLDAEHVLLYSDTALSPLQLALVKQWQRDGTPLFYAGAGFIIQPGRQKASQTPPAPLDQQFLPG